MLESINDVLSVVTCVLAVLFSLYILFVVSDRHHGELMKEREDR